MVFSSTPKHLSFYLFHLLNLRIIVRFLFVPTSSLIWQDASLSLSSPSLTSLTHCPSWSPCSQAGS